MWMNLIKMRTLIKQRLVGNIRYQQAQIRKCSESKQLWILHCIIMMYFKSVNIAHPNLTVVYLMVAERAYFYTLEDLQSV